MTETQSEATPTQGQPPEKKGTGYLIASVILAVLAMVLNMGSGLREAGVLDGYVIGRTLSAVIWPLLLTWLPALFLKKETYTTRRKRQVFFWVMLLFFCVSLQTAIKYFSPQ